MTGILSLTTFFPLVGVAAILLVRQFATGDAETLKRSARWITIVTTLATLALSILLIRLSPASSSSST
jgi:NADH-quinone oxidoreductase subunit M